MTAKRDPDDYASLVRDLVSAKRGDNRGKLWRARLLDASALIVGGVINLIDASGWLGLIVTIALFVGARSQWKFPTLIGWFVVLAVARGIAHSLGTWPY